MKTKFASQILAAILSYGALLPQSVYAEVAVKKALSGITSAEFAKTWNHTSDNWSVIQKSPTEMAREMKRLGINFNSSYAAQDRDYFGLVSSHLSELPRISIKGDMYEFYRQGSKEVFMTAKFLGNNKFQFNGKDFDYKLEESLQQNIDRAKLIFSSEQTAASFLDAFFLPRAEAFLTLVLVALAAAAVTFFVTRAVMNKNTPREQLNEDRRWVKDKVRGNDGREPKRSHWRRV